MGKTKALTLLLLAIIAVSGIQINRQARRAGPDSETYKTVVIKKDRHFSTPWYFNWENIDRQELAWLWNESHVYDLGNSNQRDWNKLTGISLHLFTNHKNSALIGWRYTDGDPEIPGDEFIEISPYFHKNGERYKADEEGSEIPIARARVGDWTNTYINLMDPNFNAIAITILTPIDTIYYELTYDIDIDRRARKINPWFGGDEMAPKDIYFRYKLVEPDPE